MTRITQIDKAQDLLLSVFRDTSKITVVLIDELDRCDPDEAFAVIKQLRILFAMRQLPIIFVMCANPDPIGQAIKHRHGLKSESGDFEARRILEKFVDLYIDISEPIEVGALVSWLWQQQAQQVGHIKDLSTDRAATLIGLDRGFLLNNTHYPKTETALQAMTTVIPMYGNLRLLQKSLEYVSTRPVPDLIWSAWHMEIINQLGPEMRSELAMLAPDVAAITRIAHQRVFDMEMRWQEGRFTPLSENFKDFSLFGLYRSFFWEEAHKHLADLEKQREPEKVAKHRIMGKWLANVLNMNFLIISSLLPLEVERREWNDGDPLPKPNTDFGELAGLLEGQIASY